MRVSPAIQTAIAVAAIALGACRGAADSGPATSTATGDPSSSPSATAFGSPSATGLTLPSYPPGTYLEALVDGLAVRAGPGTQYPLVGEYRLWLNREPAEVETLREAVRLSAGYVVRVQLGPLVVDNRAWYAVLNVPQDGQAAADVPSWLESPPVLGTELFARFRWLAASESDTQFVRRTERPSCSQCYADTSALTASATGVGDGLVGPWRNTGPAYIQIAAVPASDASTCQFRVTAPNPADFELPTENAAYHAWWVPFSVDVAPGSDQASLHVETDCTWAIVVYLEG